jgi:hypothetical protein
MIQYVARTEEISHDKGRRKSHNKKHTPCIPVCNVLLASSYDKTECGVLIVLRYGKSKDPMLVIGKHAVDEDGGL